MNSSTTEKGRTCQVCGRDHLPDLHPGILVRPAVAELIRARTGSWSEDGWICSDDLRTLHSEYVQSLLMAEKGELSRMEREVVDSMREQEILSRNPEEELQSALTRSQRLADRLATAGGSWGFIGWFVVALLAWIVANSIILAARPFDPYPYILLNLVLSCLAALQAPVIMMSQNRQEARDRLHARNAYQVNLKAELEIRHLHQKLDHFLSHQWERLVEIHEIQMDLLGQVRRSDEASAGPASERPRP